MSIEAAAILEVKWTIDDLTPERQKVWNGEISLHELWQTPPYAKKLIPWSEVQNLCAFCDLRRPDGTCSMEPEPLIQLKKAAYRMCTEAEVGGRKGIMTVPKSETHRRSRSVPTR